MPICDAFSTKGPEPADGPGLAIRARGLHLGVRRVELFEPATPIDLDVVSAGRGIAAEFSGLSGDYDLTILGTRDSGWLRRPFFGRRARWIAHRSCCPVVFVNPRAAAVEAGIPTRTVVILSGRRGVRRSQLRPSRCWAEVRRLHDLISVPSIAARHLFSTTNEEGPRT